MTGHTPTRVTIDDITTACRAGNVALLERWKDQQQLPDLMTADVIGQLPHEAAAYTGQLEALKWLADQSGQIIDLNASAAIQLAAAAGRLEVLQWLVSSSGQFVDCTAKENLAIRWAAENGQLAVVQWLIAASHIEAAKNPAAAGKTIRRVDATAKKNHAARWAIRHGHSAVVKWLVADSGQPINLSDDDSSAVGWAAENGHLELLKWMVCNSGQSIDLTANENGAFRFAAKNGHLEVIKWLILESGQQVNATALDNAAARVAAVGGHTAVLQWLVEESGQRVDVTAGNSLALGEAAAVGSFGTVEWILRHATVAAKRNPAWVGFDIPSVSTEAVNTAIQKAARYGHLEVLRWLIDESNLPVDPTADDHRALWFALSNDRKDVIEWLLFDAGLLPSVPETLYFEIWQAFPKSFFEDQIFFYYGIDPDAFDSSQELILEMCRSQRIPQLEKLELILRTHGLPDGRAARKDFYCCEAIKKVFAAGIVPTFAELEKLKQTTTGLMTKAQRI